MTLSQLQQQKLIMWLLTKLNKGLTFLILFCEDSVLAPIATALVNCKRWGKDNFAVYRCQFSGEGSVYLFIYLFWTSQESNMTHQQKVDNAADIDAAGEGNNK